MDQHRHTNPFGKRDNEEPSSGEEYRSRPQGEVYLLRHQREMLADHQDSHPSRYYSNQLRRNVDRYRPNYRPNYRRDDVYHPRVPHRNHATRNPSRLGPNPRETTTQGSQTAHFETARTSLRNAAESADTSEELDSAPMDSHPAEPVPSPERKEAHSSRAEDEYELLSEHAGGPLRRYTKKTCDAIAESITEDSDDYDMSAIEVLDRACKNVALKTGVALEVHDCWMYWRKFVTESNITRYWPDSLANVDKEVAEYRQLRNPKSDSARAAYAARLATAPVISGSSATTGTTETVTAPGPARNSPPWFEAEKNYLFEMVKVRRDKQHHVGIRKFWMMVGVAMRHEGYLRPLEEYRVWFEKYGRRHFNYDESVYFSRPSDSRVDAGRTQDRATTPEDSPVADAPRRRQGGSQLRSGRVRPRASMAERSPRIPKTPRPVKPRMSSMVLHDAKSLARGYKVQDKTAKRAEEYPLQLITPSTGERFEPFTTEPREAYDPPPSPVASPPGSPLFVNEDEPQTERNLDPSARDSTTSRLSPTPALTDSQSMTPDETSTPPEERVVLTETMPEDVNDAPSAQPNETEDAEDDIQWVSDEMGFATPPTMRPSGMDDMAQIENQIDFSSSHVSAITDSSDPPKSTAPLVFDGSLTSNETTEEAPLFQPGSPKDVDSEENNSLESEAQLLREQQERTDLEISNLRANYLRVKEAADDDKKKLDDTAQELDILILRRAEQLESQTANLAEMQRIEAELEEKTKAKQTLSIALEGLEFYG